MLVKKEAFIKKCLSIFEKELILNLPDEAFEFEMIDKAYRIIYKKIKHIKNGIYLQGGGE